MITLEDLEKWEWKGIHNLEPNQIKELLLLAKLGLLYRSVEHEKNKRDQYLELLGIKGKE